jgi:hypothetical protein
VRKLPVVNPNPTFVLRHLLPKNGELETTGLEMAIDSRDVESDLMRVQLIFHDEFPSKGK